LTFINRASRPRLVPEMPNRLRQAAFLFGNSRSFDPDQSGAASRRAFWPHDAPEVIPK
jgi:hypothetical protein